MTKNVMVEVVEWASYNKLLINFKKTNCLLLASNILLQHRNRFEVKIFGILLKITKVSIYIRILIINYLSCKD